MPDEITINDGFLRTIVSLSLQLLIVLPVFALSVRRRSEWLGNAMLLIAFLAIQRLLVTLPIHFPTWDFIGGQWNWSGKIYATIGCLVFTCLLRQNFEHKFFIRLRQNSGSLRWTIPVALLILVLDDGIPATLLPAKEWSTETLLFQLTMPGIHEELVYRGVMLGMLVTILKDKLEIGKCSLGSPAALITAIWFGLVHSLAIGSGWILQFDVFDFCIPFVWGWLWAWMTLKSGSILIPLLTHNLSNLLLNFFLMAKSEV